MVDKYTFYVHISSKKTTRYHCTSANKKCHAALILSNDINIIKYKNIHNHEPPDFFISENNTYVFIRNRKSDNSM